MKKFTGFSLFIFFCVVTAVLTAGLVFYQNKKDTGSSVNGNTNTQADLSKLTSSGVKILDLKEIAKHNKQSDCWLLISGKVYDITSYFGKHPGGSGAMLATCGQDATNAYKTKDPNASTSGTRTAHSSNAVNLLSNYFIGNLNQKIDQKTIDQSIQQIKTNSVSIKNQGKFEGEDD